MHRANICQSILDGFNCKKRTNLIVEWILQQHKALLTFLLLQLKVFLPDEHYC